MDQITKYFDLAMRYVLEPSVDWVIAHPIITVIAVVALVYWSMRGYRML